MQKSTLHLTRRFLSTAVASAIATFCVFANHEGRAADSLTFHQKPKPLAADAVTSDWPRFLGPDDNCHSPESPLLKEFGDAGPALIWEVARGTSHTAPVVAGDRLVFMHVLDDEEIVECRHPETGQLLWEKKYPVTLAQNFGMLDTTRCSPVIDIDSELVFSLGVKGKLLAMKLSDGSTAWEKDLPTEFGAAPFFFGYGGSPLIYDDKVIVNTGSNTAGIVAFEKTSGRELWRAPSEWNGSYASPVVGSVNGKPRIFAMAAGMVDPPHGGLLSLRPATGEIDDRVAWRSKQFASVISATPVPSGDGQVFITEDYGEGGAMIEFDADFKADFAWKAPTFSQQLQTSVFHESHLYGFAGRTDIGAELVCYDANSGDEKWRESFPKLSVNLGRVHLLHADEAFWAVGASGTLVKFDLSPAGAKIIDTAELFSAPETWALPALSKGLLYVPENGPSPKLRCYDLRGN